MTDSFSIMTFNTYTQGSCKKKLDRAYFTRHDIPDIPDIICTQESADLFELLSDDLKLLYNKKAYIKGCKYEAIRIYIKKEGEEGEGEECEKEGEEGEGEECEKETTDINQQSSHAQNFRVEYVMIPRPTTLSTLPEKSKEKSKEKIFPKFGIFFKYRNIKIANLHLAGGRHFDQLIQYENNFVAMLKFKLDLLTKILGDDNYDDYEDCKPDIILGDFNSVIPSNSFDLSKIYGNSSNMEDYHKKMEDYHNFLDSQYSYFAIIMFKDDPHIFKVITRLINFYKTEKYMPDSIKDIIKELSTIELKELLNKFDNLSQKEKELLSKELKELSLEELLSKIINFISKVNQLNIEPYKLLFGNRYKYAKPNNGITNLSGNTIVDCIWYNPKKVRLKSDTCHIINIMDPNWNSTHDDDFRANCISDHNPVYAEFEIGPEPVYDYKQKYIKYKNKYLKIKYNLLSNKN
jgi:hypothetical protein